MKTKATHYVILFLAGILLSSCARLSTISITKRHYRGGYYVDWGSNKPVVPTADDRVTSSPVTKIPSTVPQVDLKNYTPEEKTLAHLTEIPAIKPATAKKKQPHANYYASTKTDYVPERKTEESEFVPYAPSTNENLNQTGESSNDAPNWVIILFAILIPPVGVALKFGIVDKFWIDLLLTLLFWLPGAIYALIVVTQ